MVIRFAENCWPSSPDWQLPSCWMCGRISDLFYGPRSESIGFRYGVFAASGARSHIIHPVRSLLVLLAIQTHKGRTWTTASKRPPPQPIYMPLDSYCARPPAHNQCTSIHHRVLGDVRVEMSVTDEKLIYLHHTPKPKARHVSNPRMYLGVFPPTGCMHCTGVEAKR